MTYGCTFATSGKQFTVSPSYVYSFATLGRFSSMPLRQDKIRPCLELEVKLAYVEMLYAACSISDGN